MKQNINYDKIIKDSKFIHLWKDEMILTMERICPDLDKDILDDTLNKMIRKNMSFPDVTIDNNYTGESRESNLLTIIDWYLKRKPLVAGNATFYKNQDEAINPVADMIDGFLSSRKAFKKAMFKVGEIEGADSDKYKDLDRKQLNQKIMCNSYYGASGMPASAFYSLYSGPATTGTAQSVISTTETLFEGLLVDNYKFIDINECFHFMNEVLRKKENIENWIEIVSEDELFDRICNMFFEDVLTKEYEKIIRKYIKSLTPDEITKIYYVYNLEEFTRRHKKVLKLHDNIFSNIENYKRVSSVDEIPKDIQEKLEADGKFKGTDSDKIREYNKFINHEYFMDPNSPPDSIINYLKELNDIYMRYVYMEFMSIDRMYRLKYFPRRTVTIVDTDSNIMALDLWVDFCENEVLHGDYGRSSENNRFIIVNILTYFITSAVAASLDDYGKHSYIPDQYRSRFGMKNEFYFNRLVIGKKKKRYISSVKLREGNLLDPYKPDVKGFDFMKATTSETAKKRFDSIVRKHILESEMPEPLAILHELKMFEDEIRNSLLNGETTYLPLGNAKDLEAYKDPYSQQSVRGTIAWNFIYPDREISFPSKVSLLKLNIFGEDDMLLIKDKYPDVYNTVINNIFHSHDKRLAEKGFQVLAIPAHTPIPDWCSVYIDFNTVINNIIAPFHGVLNIFSIESPEVGKMINSVNRKTKKFSNVVRF